MKAYSIVRFALPSALVTLGVAAALGAPGEARACSLPKQTVPLTTSFVSGSVYPSNAVIVVSGTFAGDFVGRPNLDGEELVLTGGATVTVNDAPARLVSTAGESFGELSAPLLSSDLSVRMAVRVSPEPRPGQRVVLRGPDCAARDQAAPEGECPVAEFRYVAGAADTASPEVSGVTYGVRDEATLSADCSSQYTSRHFVRLPPAPERAASAPVAYVIEGFADASLTQRIFSAQLSEFESKLDTHLGHPSNGLACVRIRAFDLAGNEAKAEAVECNLPPLPTPQSAPVGQPEVEAPIAIAPVRSEEAVGCHAASTGARPTPWAALVTAAAFSLGGLRRRRTGVR
jgi:hypothetical protein